MTEKYIIQLMNKLNRFPNYKDCVKVGIGKNVELAHIWYQSGFSDSHVPYTYFLIKDNDNYIGAVLDMTHDLHWVILPKHRKKGHLSKALKQVILPYLLEETDRLEQKISINRNQIGEINYQNSLRVALNIGFKQIDEENLVFDYNSLDEDEYQLDYNHKGLTRKELDFEINELQKIAKKLNKISSKIEFAFGKEIEEYSKPSLNDTANKVAYLKEVFKDMKYDFDKN
ncbi:hypothetical protein [Flavobacterium luminosum]|uniref:GNAT family N-acetyltransferase n=1 Tax=Flavobacterium luminosum TaxID=2949086 RepID=A0ABT0TRA1_9FLAO|nr:hypothetical protein [Flavobacterium sp. HXWNR70]MCL9810039.1 hypothetical protein [Flavobacterium sp. HXWNR70]